MPSASERRPHGSGAPTAATAVVVAVAIILFPRLAPNPYIMSVGVTVISYAVLATSWNFVGGFTGYISLGHAAYSGVGGYATALLITRQGVNPWIAVVLGATIVAVISVPIGIASLRVRGASFVIVSLSLVLILLLVFQAWGSFTGGSNGLRVPRPFPPDVLRPAQHERFFYIYGVVLAAVLALWWVLDRSRFGNGLKAIREDEDKAQSLGLPTFAYKLVASVTSAFFTALAGGLYALWFGNLDPIFQFSILTGAYMVLMSLLGGMHSLFGPLLGAVIVGVAVEYFKSEYGDSQLHLVAMGVLLAVIVLFMPDGIIPAVSGWFGRFRPQATSIREQTQGELADARRADAATRDDRVDPRKAVRS